MVNPFEYTVLPVTGCQQCVLNAFITDFVCLAYCIKLIPSKQFKQMIIRNTNSALFLYEALSNPPTPRPSCFVYIWDKVFYTASAVITAYRMYRSVFDFVRGYSNKTRPRPAGERESLSVPLVVTKQRNPAQRDTRPLLLFLAGATDWDEE